MASPDVTCEDIDTILNNTDDDSALVLCGYLASALPTEDGSGVLKMVSSTLYPSFRSMPLQDLFTVPATKAISFSREPVDSREVLSFLLAYREPIDDRNFTSFIAILRVTFRQLCVDMYRRKSEGVTADPASGTREVVLAWLPDIEELFYSFLIPKLSSLLQPTRQSSSAHVTRTTVSELSSLLIDISECGCNVLALSIAALAPLAGKGAGSLSSCNHVVPSKYGISDLQEILTILRDVGKCYDDGDCILEVLRTACQGGDAVVPEVHNMEDGIRYSWASSSSTLRRTEDAASKLLLPTFDRFRYNTLSANTMPCDFQRMTVEGCVTLLRMMYAEFPHYFLISPELLLYSVAPAISIVGDLSEMVKLLQVLIADIPPHSIVLLDTKEWYSLQSYRWQQSYGSRGTTDSFMTSQLHIISQLVVQLVDCSLTVECEEVRSASRLCIDMLLQRCHADAKLHIEVTLMAVVRHASVAQHFIREVKSGWNAYASGAALSEYYEDVFPERLASSTETILSYAESGMRDYVDPLVRLLNFFTVFAVRDKKRVAGRCWSRNGSFSLHWREAVARVFKMFPRFDGLLLTLDTGEQADALDYFSLQSIVNQIKEALRTEF